MSWQDAHQDLLSAFLIRNVIMHTVVDHTVVDAILVEANFGTDGIIHDHA